MSALHAALRGDDAFREAIDAADPDTFAVGCSTCGTYYIGRFSEENPEDVCCPVCGDTRGWGESPAIGDGPKAATVVHQGHA